jgi:hypothetical protein
MSDVKCYKCKNIQDIRWDECKKCGYTSINGKYGLHDIRIRGDWNNVNCEEVKEKEVSLKTYEGGYIDLINERILIPIYFGKVLDIEGMQKAFNECINELVQNEKKVLEVLE